MGNPTDAPSARRSYGSRCEQRIEGAGKQPTDTAPGTLEPAWPLGPPEGGRTMTATWLALFRSAALLSAPSLLLAGGLVHPWIGSPGDAGFLSSLAAAVGSAPTRWAVAHLLVAVGSAFLVLAFLAIRSYLRERSNERWSLVALPFIVVGSTLYALLPAMEFAPLATATSGGDAGAAQAALLPWFRPVLLAAAFTFALGVVGFAMALARSRLLSPFSTVIVVVALGLMAAARFVPVGAAQLYVGPAAGVVALWPLAFVMGRSPRRASADESRLAGTA